VNASHNAQDLPPSTDVRDYRRGTLLGSLIVLVGMLFGLVVLFGLISHGSGIRLPSVLLAMAFPIFFVFIGLLIIGRAKLALWLSYLLAAGLLYSFSSQIVHVFQTRRSDDIYSVLFDFIWVGFWLSIVMYFHNRRRMFTGFWGSLGTRTSLNRTIHGDGN
jgi:Ca2+/Na+ antiporter